MADISFRPESKVLNEIFGRDIKYIIPEYQRPYSWDCLGKSDQNNQVNVMWDDLVNYFESNDQKYPYFIGSMVLIDNNNFSYDVVDGQQRLTTLMLLLSSIKCLFDKQIVIYEQKNEPEFLNTLKAGLMSINELLFNNIIEGVITIEKKVKIDKQSSGYNFDEVLKDAIECKEYKEESYKNASSEQKTAIKRYFNNRNFLEKKIREKFTTNEEFLKNDFLKLNTFIHFLKTRVSVVRILTSDITIAYHIFEILNNRGLPLSNKDLFRNFLIKKFTEIGDINANKKWLALENIYDFNDDFLGRWVESTNATQQKYSSYNDVIALYDSKYNDSISKKKIEIFYEDFKNALPLYEKILNVDFKTRFFKTKINFFLVAGNQRYSLNLLLSLLRNIGENIEQNDIAKIILAEYDKYINYCLSFGRFSSKPVYKCIDFINKKQWDSAVKEFAQHYEAQEVLEGFENDFYGDNETPKLFLAKYHWYSTFKDDEDVISDSILYFDKCTLEHIIPQYPSEDSDWKRYFSKKFRDDYTYKIGNMTLITSKMNSAAKNYNFIEKKKKYAHTNLPMTIELTNLREEISENYISNRNNNITQILIKEISSIY